MEQFHVKSWQLITFDSHQCFLPPKFQVSDMVHVINHQSDLFGKRVQVCNVKGTIVEVAGHEPNARVCQIFYTWNILMKYWQ